VTAGQFETGNTRLPISVWWWLGSLVVLVDGPEGAVVGGIDRHIRVVTPAGVRICPHAGAIDDHALAESHRAKRDASESRRVQNGRIDVDSIDHAIAESHIPVLV